MKTAQTMVIFRKETIVLCAIQTRSQDGSQDLDDHPNLVPSLSDEEIRIAQKRDPELCRFMELLQTLSETTI